MTPEKEALLRNKYPKIFRRSEFNSEPLDMWGLECGDGWFNLIDILCNSIQNHVDSKEKASNEFKQVENLQVIAQQVKEKFGGLRFYVVGGDEVTDSLISLVESMSFKVCESCGNKGDKKVLGQWIHTACNPCFENRVWRQSAEG